MKRKNDTFVAKGAMGWDWFNKTAIGKVNAILKANPDRKYYIMCNLHLTNTRQADILYLSFCVEE